LSGQIYALLRGEILGGRYEPGDALPSERRLSEELESSRHAVREALKRLQQAGLVAISQGGATRVRDWRRHGGLELLLEGEVPEALEAPRAAMEMRASIGADAARRCADRASAVLRAQIRARAEQLAAIEDLDARNAHYEVLWDLIVEGADNIAYRLALTTLVERQSIASLKAEAVGRELEDADAIRSLARAIAYGESDKAHESARELLERSIPPAGDAARGDGSLRADAAGAARGDDSLRDGVRGR
jgi:GntR family transcriptional regulator, transcriptional repressor for pyruvate dehydrogenase complex